MDKKQLQEEILRLKKEKDICILAHAYQDHEIWEVADYMGDSFGLSLQAQKAPQKNVIMCGVRFMAETVKTLAPEKRVFLPNADAGCPMADQMSREDVLRQYASHIREEGRVDPALAADMGDYMFLACFPSLSEQEEFIRRVLAES